MCERLNVQKHFKLDVCVYLKKKKILNLFLKWSKLCSKTVFSDFTILFGCFIFWVFLFSLCVISRHFKDSACWCMCPHFDNKHQAVQQTTNGQ